MILLAASTAGVTRLVTRPNDLSLREAALTRADELVLDLDAYRWILQETRPDALFLTELPASWYGPAAFSVIAAGRQIVSMPEFFSHPYVDWREREERRLRYLMSLDGTASAEAGPDLGHCYRMHFRWPRGARSQPSTPPLIPSGAPWRHRAAMDLI